MISKMTVLPLLDWLNKKNQHWSAHRFFFVTSSKKVRLFSFCPIHENYSRSISTENDWPLFHATPIKFIDDESPSLDTCLCAESSNFLYRSKHWTMKDKRQDLFALQLTSVFVSSSMNRSRFSYCFWKGLWYYNFKAHWQNRKDKTLFTGAFLS